MFQDSPADEVSLLSRVAAGDQKAFADLFDRLAPLILGVILRILRQRSLAEEVLQEVFLQVWRQAGAYHPDRGPVRIWILVIARSRSLDCLRSEQRLGHREEMSQAGSRRTASPVGVSRLEADERQRRLRSAVAGLPADQRVCLELTLFEGLSHGQIAVRCAAPLGTIKSRIRMGLIKVRESFAVHPSRI